MAASNNLFLEKDLLLYENNKRFNFVFEKFLTGLKKFITIICESRLFCSDLVVTLKTKFITFSIFKELKNIDFKVVVKLTGKRHKLTDI